MRKTSNQLKPCLNSSIIHMNWNNIRSINFLQIMNKHHYNMKYLELLLLLIESLHIGALHIWNYYHFTIQAVFSVSNMQSSHITCRHSSKR